jgi:single-strand DNA-binding protein
MYETQLTVVGTLITAVDKRRLPDGTTVVSFRVASNERRFDRATEAWTDGDSLYVSVTAWRRLADNVHASLVLGDPIVVRGRLYCRSYDKDGRRHSVMELEASAVGPDLTRSRAVVSRLRRSDATGGDPSRSGLADDATGADAERDDPWRSGNADAADPGQANGSHGLGEVPPEELSATAEAQGREVAVEAAVGA